MNIREWPIAQCVQLKIQSFSDRGAPMAMN